jgi:hypothetical protein
MHKKFWLGNIIVRIMKSRMLQLAGHDAWMETRQVHVTLFSVCVL